MPCTPNCGSCCDPVFLSQPMAEKVFAPMIGPRSEQLYWLQEHWAPYAAWNDGVALQCTEYDVASRSCLAYETRPQVCRGYPSYGREMNPDRLVCGYQAEAGRTVLPLVGIT